MINQTKKLMPLSRLEKCRILGHIRNCAEIYIFTSCQRKNEHFKYTRSKRRSQVLSAFLPFKLIIVLKIVHANNALKWEILKEIHEILFLMFDILSKNENCVFSTFLYSFFKSNFTSVRPFFDEKNDKIFIKMIKNAFALI